MKRENKLTKSLAAVNPNAGLNTYMDKIGEKTFSDGDKRKWKVQTVVLYQEDSAPLRKLKRVIEDSLNVDAAMSKVFRALLHAAEPEKVIEAYKALK